jgi:hypothetical protein
MMRRLWKLFVSFGQFWYSFIIGDDWLAAACVLVMLGGAYGLVRLGIAAYWFGPLAILLTVLITVRRALRRTTDTC